MDSILSYIPKSCTCIVSGGAVGVDHIAREISKILKVELIEFLPNYKKYGKRAPLIRNLEIVKHADFVFAFWNLTSRGTANTIAHCIKEQTEFKIIEINTIKK